MNGLSEMIAGGGGVALLVSVGLKATLVLLLAGGATALMRRSSAAMRHLVWCVAVLGVLALPLLSLVLPPLEMGLLPDGRHGAPAPPAAELVGVSEPSPLPVLPMEAAAVRGSAGAGPAGASSPFGWLPRLAIGLALGGVLVGLLWLAAGVWGTRRIGKRAEAIRDTAWLEAAQEVGDRLGLRRQVRMLRSRGAAMPATWGLIRPSVILPAEADRWPEERRRAVLAHELAHVKRFDCLTQTAAHLACALFWWHPVIWYAARRLCAERERACDDLVLRTGARPSEYATQLLEIARTHRPHRLAAPLLVSLAKPSQLESRLLWILDGNRSRSAPSRWAALLAVLLGFAVVAPLAAVKPVEAAHAGAAIEPRTPKPKTVVADTPASTREEAAEQPDAQAPAPRAGTTTAPAPVAAVDTPRVPQPRPPSEDEMDVEELIRMRIHGVTPSFIREMEQVGYSGLSTDQLVAMRIHGVSPTFVREMEQAGYPGLSTDQLVTMRIHGVSAVFVRQMEQLGYTGLSTDRLVAMRIHGVSPAFIREMEAAGYSGLSPDRLVTMRIHGVSPAFIREMEAVGYSGLSPDDLVRMRIHRVNAALVRSLREAGFEDLSLDTLVRLRISGVDQELIESGRRSRPGSSPP